MEFRKLIGFGKSSLVVSLPKPWLNHNKLKKGNTVYLHEADDELIVSARENRQEKEIKVVQISTDGKSIEKIESEIISAYLKNADIWELRGRNLAVEGPKVKEILQNLSGIELMEQDSHKIVAKDLMDMAELSIPALLRRIDLILRSMLQDATASVHEDYYESIFYRDVDVNRLVFLVKRVISLALDNNQVAKKLNRTQRQLALDMRMGYLLESVGDEVKRISRFIKAVDPKHKAFKSFTKMIEELQKKYLAVMKAYHTNNLNLAFEVELEHKSRMENIDSLSKKTTSHVAHRCLYHMKGLNSIIKNIARTVLS
ncbi:MAG: AbrB/MazE/SpoVT family DNA-binding domain-containing protein [Candidatus Nanoarchaeia archaeon]